MQRTSGEAWFSLLLAPSPPAADFGVGHNRNCLAIRINKQNSETSTGGFTMKNKKLLKGASIAVKILIAILTISILLSIFFPNYFPISQEEAASWIKAQQHDKIIFIALQIFQVIVPPISHYFTSILGGYIYGPIEGGTLNWIGRVIGQFIAFSFALRAGNFMRTRLNWDFTPFENIVSGTGGKLSLRACIILAMIALPFFPDDELSYAMGFARFPFWLFSTITLIGHLLGSFALAFLGSGKPFTGPLFISLAAITVVMFIGLVVASAMIKRGKGGES